MSLEDLEQKLRVVNQLNTDHLERIINQVTDFINKQTNIILSLIGITLIICIVILWNQWKIKKILRKLIEAQEARVEPGGEELKEEP